MAQTSTTTKFPKLVTATARQLHIAPRKMRLVTELVKGMNAMDAMTQLQHTNKKAAPILAKLLKSAIANAKNNFSLDDSHLFIKSVSCDQGSVLKRYFPRARGSAFVIRRKLSHVNLVLEERKSGKATKSKLALFKKKEEPAVTSVDQKEATQTKAPKELGRKSEIPKSEEQVKMNKQQNKRRLFNRKSGE